MKKIIFFIFCLISITGISDAFFGEPSSIEFYKDIDSGLNELETKMIGFELNGAERETGVIKELNQFAVFSKVPACLDEGMEMSPKIFVEMITDEDISILKDYIKEECKDLEGKDYDISPLLKDFIEVGKVYLKECIDIGEKKASRLYQLSKLGKYQDGIVENSYFDLITDNQDIDKIHFSEVVDYEPEEYVDLKEEIEKLVDGIDIPEVINEQYRKIPNIYVSNDINQKEAKLIVNNTKIPVLASNNPYNINNFIKNEHQGGKLNYSSSAYKCIDEVSNNGINPNDYNEIQKDIKINEQKTLTISKLEKKKENAQKSENNSSSSSSSSEAGGYEGIEIEAEPIESEYEKITDLSEWECEDIFCIDINFRMYEHSLFGGGEGGMSNEFVVKRSNEHLGTFMGTSLIPSKYSVNQFQLNLDGLDLPESFHIGLIVLREPLPILNLEDPGKEEKTEFVKESLIREHFEAFGLNYERRNSLVLYQDKDLARQVVNNSIGLENSKVFLNMSESDQYKTKNNNSKILVRAVEKKAMFGITESFKEPYREFDKFTAGIVKYIEKLFIGLQKIDEIEIDQAG